MQLVPTWLSGDPTREGWIWTLPEKEEHAAPATTTPDVAAVVVEACQLGRSSGEPHTTISSKALH